MCHTFSIRLCHVLLISQIDKLCLHLNESTNRRRAQIRMSSSVQYEHACDRSLDLHQMTIAIVLCNHSPSTRISSSFYVSFIPQERDHQQFYHISICSFHRLTGDSCCCTGQWMQSSSKLSVSSDSITFEGCDHLSSSDLSHSVTDLLQDTILCQVL